jgi:hypothetical protein
MVDQNKDYLNELVGDNKKFKDVQALARGKAESDAYINSLTMRMDELRTDYLSLREEVNKRATVEELIDRMKQPASRDEPETKATEPQQYKPDPRDIENLVDSKLTQRERERLEKQNMDIVRSKVRERYGNDYVTKFTQHLDDLGLEVSDIDYIARHSPKAALRTLGLDQPDFRPDSLGAPRSQVTFRPNPPEKRTWSWYQKLKQTSPEEYRSAKTNVQMHNDMMSLGEEFMDGDYFVKGLHDNVGIESAVIPQLRY